MSPLPDIQLPQSTPVEPRSAPGPLPAEAGYGGKTAGGLNIAANFLHGWLASKDVAEDKMQKQAQFEISTAWGSYQNMQAMASDPTLPEDQRKTAAGNLSNSYQNWINAIQRYTQPSDKKKKGGILSRMGGAMKAQKPQFGTEDLLSMYQSPQMVKLMSTPRGPSADQQIDAIKLKDAQRTDKQLDDVADKTQKLEGILSKGISTDADRESAVTALTGLQAARGDINTIPDPRAEAAKRDADLATNKLQQQLSTDALGAYDKKQRGLPLSPTEENLLSAYVPQGKTDPFSIYQNLIGKTATNKLTGKPVEIKNDRDAQDLYLSDQAYWAKVGRAPTEYEEQTADVKAAIRSKLKADTGQDPTDDQVRSKWLEMTTGTKPAAAKQIPTAEKSAIQQQVYTDVQANPRYKKFVGDGQAKGSLTIKPRNQFNKDDQAEYDNMLQEVGHQLSDRGYSAEDIREVTGGAGFGKDYGMTPPPTINHAGKTKKYRVSSNGQTVDQEMTDDEAAAARKSYPNWKIEEAPAGGL